MFVQIGDGAHVAGPLDVICIMRIEGTGRYHPALLEDRPLPGPVEDAEARPFVRLKSKAHHTEGLATMEEARDYVRSIRRTIAIADENVAQDDYIVVDDPVMVVTVPNWLRGPATIDEIFRSEPQSASSATYG